MKHHDQKPKLRRTGFIWLTPPRGCSSLKESGQELKQGRNLEAGADAEAMEGAAYWLAFLGFLNLIIYRTQDYQPRDGTIHNELGPSPLITN